MDPIIALKIIRESKYFDPIWYASSFPDVALAGFDPAEHYLQIGALLGRDPGPAFSSAAYLERYPDVASANVNPLIHYEQHGRTEGRSWARNTFQDWIGQYEQLTESEKVRLSERVDGFEARPLISVLMPIYNTPETLLREAIESVLGQVYDRWELCIADDASPDLRPSAVVRGYVDRDSRIKFVRREVNGHISQATNSAFELATGEWVAMLDHDDILRPHALAEVALAIQDHPGAQLIYSDEDKINEQGQRFDPFFKPRYSRELLRAQNYFNHLTVHRSDNIRLVGGWRVGFEGSQDHDLNFRIVERINPGSIVHIPKILYHWRAVAGSTASNGSEKTYAFDNGLRALQEHLDRLELPARAEPAPGVPHYRVRFAVPQPAPLVSLIIPTRDKVELLRGCIGSIRDKTTYENYEIIVVDNNSHEAETRAYFDEIEADPRISVLSYHEPFNYSAINNFAVARTNGEIIGLINNDIEVIAEDWLTEMVSWANQSDIGCVGAKLYYGNDTIQHGGVITGVGGVAGHSHKYAPRNALGYFSRLKVVQNLSAVTAACMVVRRQVYEQVGGLNAADLTVAFNDVDFCLRVRDAGYWNVWTPHAELYHLESVSRGAEDSPEKQVRAAKEIAYMKKRWSDLLEDPFYSPNLSLDREDFSLR